MITQRGEQAEQKRATLNVHVRAISDFGFAGTKSINVQPLSVASRFSRCNCMATLLVCDSDPMCLNVFNTMLRSHNVKAEFVTNSRDAIEKFIENRNRTCCDTKFRLVVMDLNLPND